MKIRYVGISGRTQGLKNDKIPEPKAINPLRSINRIVPLKNIKAMICIFP
jgi:hypothetical protein